MLGPLSAELSARGAATAAQLAQAERLVAESGGLFPTRLIEVGVRPGDVLMALARISGLPPAPASRLRFPAPGLTAAAPGPALWSLLAAPFGLGPAGLQVAFADPASAARARARLPPHKAFLGLEADIRGALQVLFGDEPAPEALTVKMAAVVPADPEALTVKMPAVVLPAPEALTVRMPAVVLPAEAPATDDSAELVLDLVVALEFEEGSGAPPVAPEQPPAAAPVQDALPPVPDEPTRSAAVVSFPGRRRGATPALPAQLPGDAGPPPPSPELGGEIRTDVWRAPVEPPSAPGGASDGRTGVWRVPTEPGPFPPVPPNAGEATTERWSVPIDPGPPPLVPAAATELRTERWSVPVEPGPPPPSDPGGSSDGKTGVWRVPTEPPAAGSGSDGKTGVWRVPVQAGPPSPSAEPSRDGKTGVWRVPVEAGPTEPSSDGRTGVWRVPVEAGPPPSLEPVEEASDGRTGVWRVPDEPAAGPASPASDGSTGVWRVPVEAPAATSRDGKTGVWAPAKGEADHPPAAPPRTAGGVLVPPTRGPTVAATLERLTGALSEGDVASALLGHSASWFSRILLLVLRDGQLCGLAGRGLARPAYETAALRIPPELLAPGYDAAPQDPPLEPLWRIYGGRPESLLVLVIPTQDADPWLLLGDEPGVAARYADLQPLKVLAAAAAQALDRVRAR